MESSPATSFSSSGRTSPPNCKAPGTVKPETRPKGKQPTTQLPISPSLTAASPSTSTNEPDEQFHNLRPPTPQHDDKDLRRCQEEVEADKDVLEQAYKTIFDKFCGKPVQEAFPLFHFAAGQQSFQCLHDRLAKHKALLEFFQREIRKDWNAQTGDLILRLMPSKIHERVQGKISWLINAELARISGAHSGLEPFCRKIGPADHADVDVPAEENKAREFVKNPDGQLGYDGVVDPLLVVEVAFSQSEKKVLKASVDFLANKIDMTVVVFDLEYVGKDDRIAGVHVDASLAVWTSELNDDDDIDIRTIMPWTTFREHGHAKPGELAFPFKLLCPRHEHRNIPEELRDVTLRFSFADLAEAVAAAESHQRLLDLRPQQTVTRKRTARFFDHHGNQTTGLPSKRPRTESDPDPGAPAVYAP